MKTRTLKEVRDELNIRYNLTLENFGRTFGIIYQRKNYCVEPQRLTIYGSNFIRDHQEIKEELYQFLSDNVSLIISFEKDYYNWKTPLDVAKLTGLEVELILDDLNEHKYIRESQSGILINIKGLKDNKFVADSKFNKISSFQIMKSIQLELRKKALAGALSK